MRARERRAGATPSDAGVSTLGFGRLVAFFGTSDPVASRSGAGVAAARRVLAALRGAAVPSPSVAVPLAFSAVAAGDPFAWVARPLRAGASAFCRAASLAAVALRLLRAGLTATSSAGAPDALAFFVVRGAELSADLPERRREGLLGSASCSADAFGAVLRRVLGREPGAGEPPASPPSPGAPDEGSGPSSREKGTTTQATT